MIKLKPKQIAAALLLSLLTALSYTPNVMAAQANSANYGVSEVQFGSGGELRACSTTYCSKQSVGESTVGNTRSTNYQAQGGLNTNREPLLEVNVTGTSVNLGLLDPATTAKGSVGFSVKSYLASGYNVYIGGTSPKIKTNGHVLAPMTTATTSQPGQEQFGINLKQNTIPVIGTDPVQVPSSVFSFGVPAAGYNTANTYKFIAGDLIAQSASSSGQTDYTMAVIANIGTITDGGLYTGRLVVNVLPTF